jgi:uncharacterized protein (UPF0335 family)
MADKAAPRANSDLQRFTDRILRLMEEADALRADIKEVFGEAKSAGFHVPAMRETIKLLREKPHAKQKRVDREMARDLMLSALGAFVETPLGQAAVRHAEDGPGAEA